MNNDINKENIDNENIDKENKKTEKLSYKQYIIIILLTTFGLMIALGFSFSIFDGGMHHSGNKLINNIIATLKGEEKLIFSYYEKPGVGNGIKLYNQFPIKDEIGRNFEGENYVFEFRLLLGEKAVGINYDIVAERSKKSDLRSDAVKIYLENEGRALKSVVRDNGRIKTFNEFPNYGSTNQKRIYSGTVTQAEAERGYIDFTFKMWVSEDLVMTQDDFQKTFISYINIYANGSI